MKHRVKQQGFTIVETMIVLAVTGLLFISAVVLVSGQQNKAEFRQAINDIQGVIQQHINEVGAGYYANLNNFTCSGSASSVDITPGNSGQGSNTGCIFLGKALQFGVTDKNGKATDPQQFITYPIAGLQNNGGNLSQSAPVVIAPTTANTDIPNDGVIDTLHYGLTAEKMTIGDIKTGTPIGSVAFVSGLGQYSGGNLVSGTQQISMVPVANSSLNASPGTGAQVIDTNLVGSTANPSGGVQICFASGTTNQSGLMTIGSNGRSLSVTLAIRDGTKC